MTTIDKDIELLEKHVQALHKAAEGGASPEKMAEGTALLVRLANKIQADQSDNSKYYGLGEYVAEEPEAMVVEAAEEEVSVGEPDSGMSKLAYDVYTANTEAATRILDMMEAVDSKVDELVTAGKKFDSKRAKKDLHAVTSKVAGIVNDVDLTAPWVAEDFAKLAARAEHLYGLFFSEK